MTTGTRCIVSDDVVDAALNDLFELSPVPFSISTTEHHSRYIKVNKAYLRLVGRSWEELDGQPLVIDLPYPMEDQARLRRMHLLETQGFYEFEEADMRHSSGRIIPTLISAQRRKIAGASFDIEIILDNSERKAFERAICAAAFVDSLTGLQNRASFDKYLGAALTTPTVNSRIVLAYIDLNRFKQINDEHGHLTGDKLLRAVAKRLCDWSSQNDFVARLGGDEFAIVSSRAVTEDFSDARFFELGLRIAEEVLIDEKSLRIGAAIGVAEATGEMTFDALLHQADEMMYRAKASGKVVDVRSSRMLRQKAHQVAMPSTFRATPT